GPSRTSLLFFAVIVVLVVREQVATTRARRAGGEPMGKSGVASLGRPADLAWAAAGLGAVIGIGGVLSGPSADQPAGPPAAVAGARWTVSGFARTARHTCRPLVCPARDTSSRIRSGHRRRVASTAIAAYAALSGSSATTRTRPIPSLLTVTPTCPTRRRVSR